MTSWRLKPSVIAVDAGDFLVVFKTKLASRLVEPQQLHKDLTSMYLSNYLVCEIREFYTVKERVAFYGSKTIGKPRIACKKNWPVCYTALEAGKNQPQPHTVCLTSQFILSNFKMNHFFKNRAIGSGDSAEAFAQIIANQRLDDEDLLMERQRHICDCADKEFERMKADIRVQISKQVSNTPIFYKGKSVLEKGESSEINQTYNEYIRKWKGIQSVSHDDKSEYSQSISSKPSHDMTHVNNTRKRRITSLPKRIQR